MDIEACCKPTVLCAMTAMGLPSTLAYPSAIATDDSSWQQVSSSGLLFPPRLPTAWCRARKLEPGLAAMYSNPRDLMTSTMKSEPGRSVVKTSTWVETGSVSGARTPAEGRLRPQADSPEPLRQPRRPSGNGDD